MMERIAGRRHAPSKRAEEQSDSAIRAAARTKSQWRIAWGKLRHDSVGMTGFATLLLLVLMTAFASVLAPSSPTEIGYDRLMESPSWDHPFGTDDLGRDVLSRVIWGGRESLRVGVVAIFIAMGGGIVVGLVSGYYRGVVDSLIQRLVEITLAFPTILLLLAIVAVFGPSLTTVLLAIGFTSIPSYSRLVRGSVLSVRYNEYVSAAEVSGATKLRVMFRHILPNMMAPILVYTALGIGDAILLTAGLSYIGLGAQPPSPEWGAMLLYGRTFLRDAWWMSIFPGLAIFVAVLSINVFGDALRDALDPRLRA
jgi:peptide/nickel transport system permease protein